jgi:hypothetical protein
MAKTVDDLLDLAASLNLPDGALDDEIYDTCNDIARRLWKKVTGGVLLEQLEFLIQNGYDTERLAEIIEELAE